MSFERIHTPYDNIQANVDYHAVLPVFNPIRLSYRSGLLGGPEYGGLVGGLITLNNLALIVDGEYIDVNGARFYFRDAPLPGDLPSVDAPGASISAIMQALYFVLNDTPALANDYEFFIDATYAVRIQAQRPGARYALTLDTSAPGMFTTSTSTPGDGNFAQTKDDYGMFVELYVDVKDANAAQFLNPAGVSFPQAQWRRIGVLQKDYAGVNRFDFDVAELIRNYVRPVPPRFVPTQGGAYPVFDTANGMIRRFAFNVGEQYTDGATVRRLGLPECMGFGGDLATAWFWAVASGVNPAQTDEETYAEYFQRWRRKPEYQPVQVLHNMPDVKQSNVQAIEYLYFLYDRGDDAKTYLDVAFSFTFEDGTQLDGQYFDRFRTYIPQSARYGGAFYVEVSPRAWDFEQVEADNGLRIARFTCRVVEHDGNTLNSVAVTLGQTFDMTNAERCVERADVLVWLNPLGGYDTWLCTGVIQKEIDAERLAHEAPLKNDTLTTGVYTYDDYARQSDRRTYAVNARNVYTVNTGWTDDANMRFLKALAHTTEVYLLRYEDEDLLTLNVWRPRRCSVRRADWQTRTDTGGDQYNLTMELELGYELNQIAQ